MYYVFLSIDTDHCCSIEFPRFDFETEFLLKSVFGDNSILTAVKGELVSSSGLYKVDYLLKYLERTVNNREEPEYGYKLIEILKKMNVEERID